MSIVSNIVFVRSRIIQLLSLRHRVLRVQIPSLPYHDLCLTECYTISFSSTFTKYIILSHTFMYNYLSYSINLYSLLFIYFIKFIQLSFVKKL